MKRTILYIILSTITFTSFSQQGVKLFGYVRQVMPGTVSKNNGENGESINKENGTPVYLVYISSAANNPISIQEMWIHGERFGTRIETIGKTPIELPNNTGKTVTLVAKTSNKVQQVVAIPFAEGKEFSLARKKANQNQLVVVYKQNGKYYSATMKKITRLEPQFSE